MSKEYDFKKEWPRIKDELVRVGQEAMELAKKGEEQLLKLTKQGKAQIDATALSLKKERLFHLIGKEYVKSRSAAESSSKMKQLLAEMEKVENDLKLVKKPSKSRGPSRSKKEKRTPAEPRNPS